MTSDDRTPSGVGIFAILLSSYGDQSENPIAKFKYTMSAGRMSRPENLRGKVGLDPDPVVSSLYGLAPPENICFGFQTPELFKGLPGTLSHPAHSQRPYTDP